MYLTIFPFDDVPIILDDQKLSIDENSSNGSIVGSVSYDDEIYFRDSDLTGTFNLKVEDIVCGLNTSSNNSQDYKNGLNSIEGKIVISKDSEDKYKIKTIVNDTINLDGDWSFGSDCLCYDIINENNPISNLYLDTRGGTVLLNHVDDSVYLSGYSKYSEVQIIENVISSNENLIFDWRDDYNSSSKVIISRDDNVNWEDIIERKNDKIGVGGSLIWEIVSGNENNTFSIDQFGEIKILNNQLLNYEQKQRFTLQIRVSDGRFL